MVTMSVSQPNCVLRSTSLRVGSELKIHPPHWEPADHHARHHRPSGRIIPIIFAHPPNIRARINLFAAHPLFRTCGTAEETRNGEECGRRRLSRRAQTAGNKATDPSGCVESESDSFVINKRNGCAFLLVAEGESSPCSWKSNEFRLIRTRIPVIRSLTDATDKQPADNNEANDVKSIQQPVNTRRIINGATELRSGHVAKLAVG